MSGVLLVLTALALGWSGVALDLAMELGVGAIAIVVLDILVLGVLQRGLERVAVVERAPRQRRPGPTVPRSPDQG